MKFTSVVLAMAAGSASAFTAKNVVSRPSTSVFVSTLEKPVESVEEKVADAPSPAVSEPAPIAAAVENELPADRIIPGRYNEKSESVALPFMKRPTNLDGSHAGDFGFDPLGFSESYDLYTMQESELRHARLAMLAVAGWPLSELIAPKWMLQENGCAPSVLNGVNPVSAIAILAFLGAAGFFEYQTSLRATYNTSSGVQHREDMAEVWDIGVAGDYNFDPLNLYSKIGDSAVARKGLREVEISHGRMAMLGITYFAGWEAVTHHPIVENSMFFHPNLMLPALVAGYVGFNWIYDVEMGENKISIKKTSEGEATLENLKMSQRRNAEKMEGVIEVMGYVGEKVGKLGLGEKLSELTKNAGADYTDFAMRNYKKD